MCENKKYVKPPPRKHLKTHVLVDLALTRTSSTWGGPQSNHCPKEQPLQQKGTWVTPQKVKKFLSLPNGFVEKPYSSILDDEIYIMGRPNFRFLVLLKVVVPHVLMFSNLCPMFDRYISKWSRVVYLIKNILAVTCPIRKKKQDFFKLNTWQPTMFQPIQTCQGFPNLWSLPTPNPESFLNFPPPKARLGDHLATRQKKITCHPNNNGFFTVVSFRKLRDAVPFASRHQTVAPPVLRKSRCVAQLGHPNCERSTVSKDPSPWPQQMTLENDAENKYNLDTV